MWNLTSELQTHKHMYMHRNTYMHLQFSAIAFMPLYLHLISLGAAQALFVAVSFSHLIALPRLAGLCLQMN